MAFYLSSFAAVQAQVLNAPPQLVVPRATDGNGNGRGVDTTKVYEVVERMPTLPASGGSRAIVEALQQAVGGPTPGKETVRVVVEFIIDRAGQARLLKASSPALDQVVLAAVSKLPQFTPGSQQGEAVYVRFRVPVLVSSRF